MSQHDYQSLSSRSRRARNQARDCKAKGYARAADKYNEASTLWARATSLLENAPEQVAEMVEQAETVETDGRSQPRY